MEALGNAAEALAMARADELAAMDESLRATQLLIWAAQDAADATQKLADAMAAATNLSASLAASINNIKYGQSYGYHQTLESNLQTIAGMTGIPEKYRQHLIDQAMEYYDLQMDSLSAAQDTAAYSTQTSRAQLDILEALESTITEWKDTYDDLANQILGYKTTTANPQDVVERLAIAKQAIMDVTGGMSAMDYVASLGTPEEQAAAIQILQNLYDNYLNLAQEAYQRPSSEYQAIYAETMGELSTLLSYMESYSESEWQISIDQLDALYAIRAEIERLQDIINNSSLPDPVPDPGPDPGPSIPDWLTSQYSTIYNDFLEALNSGSPGPGSKVDLSEMYGPGASAEWFEGGIMKFITTEGETFWYDAMTSLFDIFLNNPDIAAGWAERYGSGSFAAGGYVPETGLAYVHEGEYITPKGYDYPEMQGNNVTFQLNITGNDQPQEVGKVVKNELSSFMRSGEGRKLIQSTAKGR